MNESGEIRDPFEPTRVGKAMSWRRRTIQVVAIVLCTLSAYTAVMGFLASCFVGMPIGIVVSLLWVIPAVGFGYLAVRMDR